MDTSKIKKGLGRGLSSLIGETKTEKNTFTFEVESPTKKRNDIIS